MAGAPATWDASVYGPGTTAAAGVTEFNVCNVALIRTSAAALAPRLIDFLITTAFRSRASANCND